MKKCSFEVIIKGFIGLSMTSKREKYSNSMESQTFIEKKNVEAQTEL